MDFSQVEEVNFEGGLIPVGRVEMCAVTFGKDKRTTEKGNGYVDITLEVTSGPYAGSKFYDNVALDGPDGYFLQRGKTVVRYILECTYEAHKKPHFYNINSPSELISPKVLVKVDIEPHLNKKGEWLLVNKAKAYGTPREDSRSFKYFAAWAKGEQPWETDERPSLPANNGPSKSANGNYPTASYGQPAGMAHVDQDIPL